MWQVSREALFGAALTPLLMALAAHATAAEFRTSVRGRPLVRQVEYQQPLEEIDPLGIAGPGSLDMSPTADCCGDVYRNADSGPRCDRPCRPGWVYSGSFEFLLWWPQGQNFPPLVTSSSNPTDAGALGFPGTTILYGSGTQLGEARPGGRLTLEVWFDACQLTGIGTRLFSLAESTAQFAGDGDEMPVLGQPFFDVTQGMQNSFLIASPAFTSGSVSVRSTSRISGGDAYIRRMLFTYGCRRLDVIAGYQFAEIDGDLSISSQLSKASLDGDIADDTTLHVTDSFDSRNSYHAIEIGLWGVYERGPITWSLLAKVGLGNMRQRTAIAGQRVIETSEVDPAIVDQGLLALDTNSGVFQRNVFAVSPEIAFSGSYHLTPAIALTFGYSFIYWDHVAQPGDQIDTTINQTQITGVLSGVARPAFLGRDAGYGVHGLNLGVQWLW